ncbi:MAG: class F sortase [Ornithinimicrobium sp.]
MSDQDHASSELPDGTPTAGQLRPRPRTSSWPFLTVVAGVASLALLLATMVGYSLAPAPQQADRGTSLAESAAAAGLDPTIPGIDGAGDGSDSQSDNTQEPSPATAGSDTPAPRFDPDASIQAPANRGMLHIQPISVAIPRIDVSSTLVDLGLNADNSLEVPENYGRAGWYVDGSYPGDSGGPPALIVGHVDNSEGPAIFHDLNKLGIGDEILVTRADGSTAYFAVYDGEQFAKNSLPTDEIYADREGSEIVLITCSGDFDVEAGSYLDNYVVKAKLSRARSGLDI